MDGVSFESGLSVALSLALTSLASLRAGDIVLGPSFLALLLARGAADTVLVVTREVVLLATLLTELRDDAKPASLEAMDAEDGCSRRARLRLRRLTRMLLAASLSASTLEVWGWFDMGLSRRPECARFDGPLTVRPVLEYVGGLRRSSTGTSISGNHKITGKAVAIEDGHTITNFF
jgi:hypothetical protein